MLDFIRARLEAWIAYRDTVDSLDGIDDRLLLDMGIPRKSIRWRARRVVYGTDRSRRG